MHSYCPAAAATFVTKVEGNVHCFFVIVAIRDTVSVVVGKALVRMVIVPLVLS